MNRRTFIAALCGTALTPLVPVGLGNGYPLTNGISLRLVEWTGHGLIMDFENDYYERNGVQCRMEDVITLHGDTKIDYDKRGRCLGLWVGEDGGATLNGNLQFADLPLNHKEP